MDQAEPMFDMDFADTTLEYGVDCEAPPLSVHCADATVQPFFFDLQDRAPVHRHDHRATLGDFTDSLSSSSDCVQTPEGSSPEQSPLRASIAKNNKRRKSAHGESRKRTACPPPSSPSPAEQHAVLARSDEQTRRIELANRALHDMYHTVQQERLETFRALRALADENRRMARRTDELVQRNLDLAMNVLQLSTIVRHMTAAYDRPHNTELLCHEHLDVTDE